MVCQHKLARETADAIGEEFDRPQRIVIGTPAEEIPHLRGDPEFLEKLPRKTVLRSLSRFDLASGKLPLAR